MRHALSLVAVLSTLAATACNPFPHYTFDDSTQGLDFSEADHLAPAYVRGAEVAVWAEWTGEEKDWTGYRITSADPSILAVNASEVNEDIEASAIAVAVGETSILLQDGEGTVVHEAPVRVSFPTRAQVIARGSEQVEGAPSPGADETWQVLVGGIATLEVRYWDGDVRLYGEGMLDAKVDAGSSASTYEDNFLVERNWLQVTLSDTEVHPVRLLADGTPFDTLQVRGVDASAIDALGVYHSDTEGAEDDTPATTLVQARDADGTPIFGVTCAFTRNRIPMEETGDLLDWTYQAGHFEDIVATCEGHDVAFTIEGRAASVDSTADFSCSSTGRTSAGWLALGLGLAGIAGRRGRKSLRSPSR